MYNPVPHLHAMRAFESSAGHLRTSPILEIWRTKIGCGVHHGWYIERAIAPWMWRWFCR
jgi:hypothetical protein